MTLRDQGGVSLVHPFYKDDKRLALQLAIWKDWSPDVCKHVDITVVDDGSPNGFPLNDDIKKLLADKGLKFTLYKINRDIKWNTPGALNLGLMTAPKPWIMCMDTDCFFPSAEWEKILDLDQKLNRFGTFPRIRYGDAAQENLKNTRFLPCTLLMHKTAFLSLGGFDEDFAGERSGGWGYFDTDFTERAIQKILWSEKATCGIVYDGHTAQYPIPVITAGEWMPSVYGEQGITYQAAVANPQAHNINKRLYYEKHEGRLPQNKEILRFPWEQVWTNWF